MKIDLQHLTSLDFDVTVTGFEMAEIDLLIAGLEDKPQKAYPADAVPNVTGPAVTRLGDIWHIGPHRLNLRRWWPPTPHAGPASQKNARSNSTKTKFSEGARGRRGT